jgi:mRNA interferase MazF
MAATLRTTITIPTHLRDQAVAAARALGLSRNELFARAVAEFLQRHPEQTPVDAAALPAPRGAIQQGALYWVQLTDPSGAGPGVRHPHVILQDDVLNASRLTTVAACALTTNLKRAKAPGNVLLEAGEGGLAKPSVVEVSKVSTVEKAQLGEYIGALSPQRTQAILAGLRFLQRSFLPER